jgi:peptidoglycan-N-acetylglucosamine deacetylase
MNADFPRFLRPFMGKLTWRRNPSLKVIYLTFDDGPVPEATPEVLDILDKYKIKATFFCVGENVQKYPVLYAELLRQGHKTANHTFNHLKGFSTPTEAYVENVQKGATYINSKLFRPPHGQITPRQRKILNSQYEIIMWDLITHDYDRKLKPSTILTNIKNYSRNGSIVVFHDSIKAKDNMLAVLPLAIEYWISEGYGFGTL